MEAHSLRKVTDSDRFFPPEQDEAYELAIIQPPPPSTAEHIRRAALIEAMASSRYTLQDLTYYRLVAVWRLTRHLAMLRRILPLEATLAETLTVETWTKPFPAASPQTAQFPIQAEVLRLLEEVPQALLPPEGGRALEVFIEIVGLLAADLQMNRGAPLAPWMGRYGLRGLSSPDTIGKVWPTPKAICDFEMLLVEAVTESLIEEGVVKARRELHETLGLREDEKASVMAMARRRAEQMVGQASLEENRAIASMRAEQALARAKDNLNLREEVNILKLISQLQGLTKSEPEDFNQNFRVMVENIAERRRAESKLIESQEDQGANDGQ